MLSSKFISMPWLLRWSVGRSETSANYSEAKRGRGGMKKECQWIVYKQAQTKEETKMAMHTDHSYYDDKQTNPISLPVTLGGVGTGGWGMVRPYGTVLQTSGRGCIAVMVKGRKSGALGVVPASNRTAKNRLPRGRKSNAIKLALLLWHDIACTYTVHVQYIVPVEHVQC